MGNKCINCEFARYTEHDGKVGCGYWSAKYFQDNIHATENQRISDMLESGLEDAWLGWVFLKRPPHEEKSDAFGAGLMTNNCLIVKEDDYCNKYEKVK